MASIGSLVIDLLAKTASFETDLDRAAKTAKKRAAEIEKTVSGLSRKISGGLAAIGVGFSFAKIIDATRDAEAALSRLDNAVRNNAGAAGASTEQLASFATKLQNVSTFSDDAIQGMQALLLSFRQIRGSEFERAQKAILDVASALGKDLNSSALLVGRALADPVKGMSALSRAGVVLTSSQKALIENLTKTGKASEAQAELLRHLEARFGGAAAAARNNLSGALSGLKNAFDDLLEGDPGKTSALTTALNDLTRLISNPEVKAGLNNIAALLLQLIALAARAAASIGRIFGTIVEHARGGTTEVDLTISKIKTLQAQFQSLERGFNEQEKDSLRRRIAALQSQLDRQTGRGGPLTRGRRRRPEVAAADDDEPTSDADAVESIQKVTRALEQQIATYEKGESATLSYRIAQGDLAEDFKKAGTEAEPLRSRLVSLTEQLEALKRSTESAAALKEIQDLTASLQQQVATFERGSTATLRFRIEHGDLAKTFATAGESADEYRRQLLQLNAQLELMKEASAAADDSVQQTNDRINDELQREADQFFAKLEKPSEKFTDQVKDATFDALAGGIETAMNEGAAKGWKGFLDAGLDTINRLVAVALAKKLAESLFGDTTTAAASGGGSGGGWIAALASIFGGARAQGGPVSAGRMYRVNEIEPEFFRPNGNGQIVPLSKMPGGGGVQVTQNISVSGRPDSRTASQMQIEAARRQRIASARLG